MNKPKTIIAVAVAVGFLSACRVGGESAATKAAETPRASPPAVNSSPTSTKVPAATYTDAGSGAVMKFARGYPKVVLSETVPIQMRDYFPEQKAVALARGVWTNLSEGAEIQHAAATGHLIGYCPAVKAFQRNNATVRRDGTCW